jgi:hypothetical protein
MMAKHGMLPTPTAMDAHLSGKPRKEAKGRHAMSLAHVLLPTPTARDWRSGKASAATHARNSRPLSEELQRRFESGELLPTPTATDAKERGYTYSRGNHDDPCLTLPGVVGGRLNPRFVLEMMGFPPDWLDDRSKP